MNNEYKYSGKPYLEEGYKRYAPTRLEWLALQLNIANLKGGKSDFIVSYFPFYDRFSAWSCGSCPLVWFYTAVVGDYRM